MRKHVDKYVSKYKELPKRKRITVWSVGFLAFLGIPAGLNVNQRLAGSGEASFYIVAPSQVAVDDTFTVELHVKTGGKAINAVSSIMEFNPKRLEIVTMTTSPSFCSFYTENSFDTIKGEVRLACGKPSPGFTGDSTLVLINMRAKTTGSTEIKVREEGAMILANDGKGSNLTGALPAVTINSIHSL